MINHQGTLDGRGLRIGVVAARYNGLVTDRLLDGALAALRERGVADEQIEIARVPGSFEVPLFARLFASTGRIDAVVCLGAIIRGETPHFDYISQATVGSLCRLMESYDLPIVLGVLTTDTIEQALERAGGTLGNKGAEAAEIAVEMATLKRQVTGHCR